MIDFSLMGSTFGLIFLAELPDKTALATTVLSSSHTQSPVKHTSLFIWLGACCAFLLHTTIAVLMGEWVTSWIHPDWIRRISAFIFVFFAYSNWKASRKDEIEEKSGSIRNQNPSAFLQSFLMVIVAEAGDLTQITTFMLSATTQNTWSVFLGAMAALASVAGLAVSVGQWLGKKIPNKKIELISAFVFLGIAVFLLNPLNYF